MPRQSLTPAFTSRPSLRRRRKATGLLAVLFVWLSVLAPALHQHNRAVNAPAGRVSSASTIYIARAANNNQDAVFADTIGINAADDFCALCDYLTISTFAPPPLAPICTFAETSAVRGPPLVVSPTVPLLRRALCHFSPRAPPTRA